MSFRFPLTPRPSSARPCTPVRLVVETLEDRLPPGSLLSASLPAIVDPPAADLSPDLPQRTRQLDGPLTLDSAPSAGAEAHAADGLFLSPSRAESTGRDGQPQRVTDRATTSADPAAIEIQPLTAGVNLSSDQAPSEAALSAVAARRFTSEEAPGRSEVTAAAAALVGAPDAGLPRSPAVTAPQAGSPGHFNDQLGTRLAATSGDGLRGPKQPPLPPPPTSVNDFHVSRNVDANSRAVCNTNPPHGYIQSETAVAVSGRAVVAAYNDFRGFFCAQNGYQVTGWAYSLDGGHSFTDGGPLPGRQSLGGDPELATGPDGTIYLASLWNPLGGLAVLRGAVTTSGISWSNPTVIMTQNEGYDKENIAVDQTTGTIYLTYTRFGSLGSGIGLYVSHDGGLTFQGPTAAVPVGGVQGSVPVVGPNGELYIAYNIGYPSDSGIGFVKSTDGGHTFTTPHQIAPTTSFAVLGADRSPSFPHMAVDDNPSSPFYGNLYVSWQSALHGTGEAVLTRSTDGGQTWTSPQLINNDGGSGLEWFPTVSVDSQGNLDSFFYSRRQNPGTRLTNLYFAQSTDGGQTFGPAFAVTNVASNWNFTEGGYTPVYGDYINAVTAGTSAVVAYADGRNGDPDSYVIRVTPEVQAIPNSQAREAYPAA